MEIHYFGLSCFRIKGKELTLIVDPFSKEVGLRLPKVTADVAIFSNDRPENNDLNAIEKNQYRELILISGPGEYEASGVFIFGYSTKTENKVGNLKVHNTLYTINIDGVRLAHLGNLDRKLTEEELEEVNGVDVLLIPVGGNSVLTPKNAVEVTNQIDPSIVIPMQYQLSGLNIQLLPVSDFLKEIGVEVKAVPKIAISKDSLPEEREVVVLENK